MRNPLRRFLAAATAAAALSFVGCTPDPVSAAQDFADRHHPGELRVIAAENEVGGPVPFPVVQASYAVTDDPDAYVQISALREEYLAKALAEARWAAEDLRTLERVFDEAGFALVGLSMPQRPDGLRRGVVYIRGPLTDVAESMVLLDRALADWYEAGRPDTGVDLMQVKLLGEDPADPLPGPESGLPRIVSMTWPARLDALDPQVSFSASATEEGQALRTLRASLVPTLTEPQLAEIGAVAHETVSVWMRETGREGLVQSEPMLAWSFLLDDVDELRTYLLVCAESQPSCRPVDAVAVAGVTVDLGDLTARDPALPSVTRTPGGGFSLPLEPDLVPGATR